MAPEIILGNKYNEKSDIFSFGLIIWEIIMRKIPFYGYSLAQLVFMYKKKKFDFIEMPV